MALTFRYRYVDFGTAFIGDAHDRDLQCGALSSRTLFANELATDVGGTCWGPTEPLTIIDHHWTRRGQFPSASVAVLHKAKAICERFVHLPLVWLVTHNQPDFDAICSMYLARWIIENPDVAADFSQYGLHADSWSNTAAAHEVDWFSPDFSRISPQHRWAFRLAQYASLLDMRRRISCPRRFSLRSVLYAALKRGRDYLNETSGATEFFDEVRVALVERDLDPVTDFVLEGSARFAPELALLQSEDAIYERDIKRARRALVYLPESEAPSPDFFNHSKGLIAQHTPIETEHLLLADTFRIPTDGIYLRDPECLLFEEWARVDLDNSSQGTGFEFTAIVHSGDRPHGSVNQADYRFSIDPERANGRHLYTVWSRLQTLEVDALRSHGEQIAKLATPEARATLGTLLSDPWVGGQSQFGISVDTPQRGTLIASSGSRSDLRDDAVVEAVRSELENLIYSAASLVTGPQVNIGDFGSQTPADTESRWFDLNDPLRISAPAGNTLRFAELGLRADVPLSNNQLAVQIGEMLWQVLYPEFPGATPADFTGRHLFVTGDLVGVWSERGVAVARKRITTSRNENLRETFASMVALMNDADQLARATDIGTLKMAESAAAKGEDLARGAVEIQRLLAMPSYELLRRFYQDKDIETVLNGAQELSRMAAERLRREFVEQEAKRAEAVSVLQSRIQWTGVLVVALIAVTAVTAIAANVGMPNGPQDALLLLGAPVVTAVAAFFLKPWKRRTQGPKATSIRLPIWILALLGLACGGAWITGLVQLWNR